MYATVHIFRYMRIFFWVTLLNNFYDQENIPNATAEKVKAGMLGGVEAALGLQKESLQKPFYTRVQLW